MRWRWGRTAESLLVVGLFVVGLVVLAGPSRFVERIQAVDLRIYVLVFPVALLWLFAWSQTLLRLLESRSGDRNDLYFYVVYLAGMFARGLVPGGSLSGPAVMAYVVNAYTEIEPERTIAMATISELCYWGASMTAAVVGVALLAATGGLVPNAVAPLAAAGLLGAVVVALVVAAAARPDAARRVLRWPFVRLGRPLGRVSDRAGAALAPEAVDERVDNAIAAVRDLRTHPRATVTALAYAHVGMVMSALTLYLSLLAMGNPIDPWVPLFVVPIAGLVRGLSILPGGVGTVEAGMVGLLTVVAPLSAGVAGTAVLLHRVATFWFRLLVGALCLLALGLAKSPISAIPDPAAG